MAAVSLRRDLLRREPRRECTTDVLHQHVRAETPRLRDLLPDGRGRHRSTELVVAAVERIRDVVVGLRIVAVEGRDPEHTTPEGVGGAGHVHHVVAGGRAVLGDDVVERDGAGGLAGGGDGDIDAPAGVAVEAEDVVVDEVAPEDFQAPENG